jgi:hypothetical protein
VWEAVDRARFLQPTKAAGKEFMETDHNREHALQEFAEKLRHLEEENRHLRAASHAFGQLAERLNATLQQQLRRVRNDRP